MQTDFLGMRLIHFGGGDAEPLLAAPRGRSSSRRTFVRSVAASGPDGHAQAKIT